jgi:hypothetical protein
LLLLAAVVQVMMEIPEMAAAEVEGAELLRMLTTSLSLLVHQSLLL